jgi:peptidoglycan/xylan/chitin deacetylase (PgdA/CDA1 family)
MADAVILTYHSIDASGSRISVAPDALERQLDIIAESGRVVTTVSGLLARPRGQRAIAITFDDGFASVAERALPALARRGLVATAFPISSRLGTRIRWRDGDDLPALALMSANDVRGLAESGWEIGSHTPSHECLPDAPEGELAELLATSRADLEALGGGQVRGLAYPNGCHTAAVRRAAADAGFAWALSTTPGAVHPGSDPFDIPRVNIGPTTTTLRFRAAFSGIVQHGRRLGGGHRPDSRGHTHGAGVQVREFAACE